MPSDEMVEKARQVAAHISEQFNDRGRDYDNQPSLEELADTLVKFAASAVQDAVREIIELVERAWELPDSIILSDECEFVAAALRKKYGLEGQ